MLKRINLAFLLFIFAVPAPAQDIARLGLGLETFSSGNTHGAFYRPYFGYEWGRNFVGLGPLVHKRSLMVKGLKLAYSRNLSGPDDRFIRAADGSGLDLLQLNLVAYAQYNAGLPMSYTTVKELQRACPYNDIDWGQVQLATAEAGLGFEVRVNLGDNFVWRNSSMAAVHYHTTYVKGMSRSRMAPTLSLSTGLLFVLN